MCKAPWGPGLGYSPSHNVSHLHIISFASTTRLRPAILAFFSFSLRAPLYKSITPQLPIDLKFTPDLIWVSFRHTVAYIQLNWEAFKEGSTSFNRCVPIPTHGTGQMSPPWSSPPTQQAAQELHSTLGKEVSSLEDACRPLCLLHAQRQALISWHLLSITHSHTLLHTHITKLRQKGIFSRNWWTCKKSFQASEFF